MRTYRPMNTMFCKIMEKMKSAGKKRRLSVLLAAAMVLCLAATLLAACNKGDKLPSDTPVSWEDILSEAAEEVTERVALSGDKIGVKFTADVTLGGNAYSLFFGLNYDLSAKDGSSLVLKVSETENSAGEGTDAETAASDGTLFSVAADGEYTWIDIAAGLAVPDAKLRVENVDLFDLLGVIYDEENSAAAVEAFSEVVYNLGMTFFDGARVSADGSEYRFDVDSDYKETGREYFAAVFSVFGENVSGALLAAFGISDAYELLDVLPELDVVYMLRIQRERLEGAPFPSQREYHMLYGLTEARERLMKPEAIVCHPGPINRGVELDSYMADHAQRSVILDQVYAGICVRMAALYLLLGGADNGLAS